MSVSPRNLPTDRPWQQGGDEPVSFGSWLRRQREVREISLREIADASKISLRYLEAFEQDHFDGLPAPVFARGFLREYAKYVGLDPDEVVNHFLSAQQELEPEEDNEAETAVTLSRRSSPWPKYLLLAIVVLGLIALVALVAFQIERARTGRGEEPAPAAEEQVDDEPPPANLGLVETQAGTEGAAVDLDGPLLVTLDFRDDCWVEVFVDGQRQVQGEMPAGESLRFEAESQVVLTLGNAGGVVVRVNGRAFDPGGGPGQVVRGVTIDRETARALAEGA